MGNQRGFRKWSEQIFLIFLSGSQTFTYIYHNFIAHPLAGGSVLVAVGGPSPEIDISNYFHWFGKVPDGELPLKKFDNQSEAVPPNLGYSESSTCVAAPLLSKVLLWLALC